MRLRMIAIFLLLFPCTSIVASSKYTAAFLNIGAGARAAAMGGSFSALGLDATTIYWNPAALGRLSQPEIVLMHSTQFNNLLKYDTGHLVIPNTVSGSFGIGYLRLATGDIYFTDDLGYYDWGQDNLPGTGDPGEGDGQHNPGEMIIYDQGRLKVVNDAEQAIFLSYAHQVLPRLALGGNIKYLWQSVGRYSSFGWGIDLGAIYDVSSRLTLALNLQDVFGTVVRWSTGHTDNRTINIRPAIAYRLPLPAFASQLNLASDIDLRFDNIKKNCDAHLGRASYDFHVGAEYWLYQTIALRVGSERKSLTAGGGVRISFFEVDYAFNAVDLGNTHRISLTLHQPPFTKKSTQQAKEARASTPLGNRASTPLGNQDSTALGNRASTPLGNQDSTALGKRQTVPGTKMEQEINEEIKKSPETSVTEALPLTAPKLVGVIYFDEGRAELLPASISSLQAIAVELRNYPQQRIKIVGHTDNRRIQTADFPDNQILSEARAKVVAAFLSQREQIEAARISTSGLGATQPVAPNDSDSGRSKNRRVEVIITTARF